MPSYQCNKCKTWFAETSKNPCPKCGSNSVREFYADGLVYNLAVIEGRHKAGEITDAEYEKFKKKFEDDLKQAISEIQKSLNESFKSAENKINNKNFLPAVPDLSKTENYLEELGDIDGAREILLLIGDLFLMLKPADIRKIDDLNMLFNSARAYERANSPEAAGVYQIIAEDAIQADPVNPADYITFRKIAIKSFEKARKLFNNYKPEDIGLERDVYMENVKLLGTQKTKAQDKLDEYRMKFMDMYSRIKAAEIVRDGEVKAGELIAGAVDKLGENLNKAIMTHAAATYEGLGIVGNKIEISGRMQAEATLKSGEMQKYAILGAGEMISRATYESGRMQAAATITSGEMQSRATLEVADATDRVANATYSVAEATDRAGKRIGSGAFWGAVLGGGAVGMGTVIGSDLISQSVMNAGNSVKAGVNLGVAEVGANFAGVINQQDSILDEIKDKAGQTINVTKNYNLELK